MACVCCCCCCCSVLMLHRSVYACMCEQCTDFTTPIVSALVSHIISHSAAIFYGSTLLHMRTHTIRTESIPLIPTIDSNDHDNNDRHKLTGCVACRCCCCYWADDALVCGAFEPALLAFVHVAEREWWQERDDTTFTYIHFHRENLPYYTSIHMFIIVFMRLFASFLFFALATQPHYLCAARDVRCAVCCVLWISIYTILSDPAMRLQPI